MKPVDKDRVKDFTAFINARERHRVAKLEGRPPRPVDPIIAKYRFCNVRRNDDRVTKWIHENYLAPWRKDPSLWFALVVARLFNNEDTLEAIKPHVLPYNPLKLAKTLKERQRLGLKNFNAAYIVSTNGNAMNKVDYLLAHVLTPLWKHKTFLDRMIESASTLNEVHKLIQGENGLASFMAAQVVADLKYAYPNRWEDFNTFAASGPGSRRGLNRLLNRDPEGPITEQQFRAILRWLRDSVNARVKMEPITAQDIQNCLCEFDKYERALHGGKPKQLYKPQEK